VITNDNWRVALDVNLGGTVVKSLIGTTTVADLHELHSTLGKLKPKEAGIVHSLANQLTYVKGVAQNTRIITDAITNLSSIVKHVLVQ
jgi:hypothetical protein